MGWAHTYMYTFIHKFNNTNAHGPENPFKPAVII